MRTSPSVKEIIDELTAPHQPARVEDIRRAAFTPVLRAIDDQKRTITFVSSTEAVDRYGDIIRVAGWDTKNYLRNPVFLFGHRSSDPPIGKCVDIHIENSPPALVQKIEFADKDTYPFADTIYKLFKGGFMSAVSVSFKPTKPPKRILDDKDTPTGGYEFNGQELFELSAVPIPANPEALGRAVASAAISEDERRAFVTKSGEMNPPWANHVPGVTSAIEKLDEDTEDDPDGLKKDVFYFVDLAIFFGKEILAAAAAKTGKPVELYSDGEVLARAKLLAMSAQLGRAVDALKSLPGVKSKLAQDLAIVRLFTSKANSSEGDLATAESSREPVTSHDLAAFFQRASPLDCMRAETELFDRKV